MQINNIGILSPGDMGSAVGKVLIDNGYKVFTNLDGRSERTKKLSEKAGIISLPSLSRILSDCEIVLSILVPSEALGLAKRISKTNSSNNLPLFVDCNAVSPTTKKNISKIMIDSGMEFIDGGIVGPPPRDGNIPRLYVSGPKSSDLLQLNNKGIEVVVLGKEIGQASRLKMLHLQSKWIMESLLNIDGLLVELNYNTKGDQPFGVFISIDKEKIGISNEDLLIKLKNNTPYIWTKIPECEDRISIHVFGLNYGEADIVGKSIKKIISNPN